MIEKIVLTGGPCTGKTSVLNELKSRGYTTLPEVARSFIKSEKQQAELDSNYIPLLPKTNRDLFQKVLALKQELLESSVQNGRVFLDRSLVDIAAYGSYWNPLDPTSLDISIKKAGYKKIFLFDPVPYTKDNERGETEQEAQAIHKVTEICYERYGFPIIRVPVLPIKQRTDFVLWQLKGGDI